MQFAVVAVMMAQASQLPIAKIRAEPSPATIQAIAAMFEARPEPQIVPLQCRVDQRFGRVLGCIPLRDGARMPDATFEAALVQWRLRDGDYTVEDAAVQMTSGGSIVSNGQLADHPGMVRIDQVVDFSQLPVIAPSPLPPLEQGDVAFRAGPRFASAEDLYPPEALRRGVGARLIVTCRVQPQAQLFCHRVRFADPTQNKIPSSAVLSRSISVAFMAATIGLLEGSQVGPTTKVGSATIGRDIQLPVTWTLP